MTARRHHRVNRPQALGARDGPDSFKDLHPLVPGLRQLRKKLRLRGDPVVGLGLHRTPKDRRSEHGHFRPNVDGRDLRGRAHRHEFLVYRALQVPDDCGPVVLPVPLRVEELLHVLPPPTDLHRMAQRVSMVPQLHLPADRWRPEHSVLVPQRLGHMNDSPFLQRVKRLVEKRVRRAREEDIAVVVEEGIGRDPHQ